MAEQRALALFDFDGTLLPGDSIVRYVKFAVRRGRLSIPGLARVLAAAALALNGTITEERAKSCALAFLRRMTPEARRAFDEDFYREQIEPFLYAKGLARLRAHQAQGDAVVLVTASPACYMQRVAERLCVGLLATPTDAAGRVTGANLKGEEKPRRIRAFLEAQPFAADFSASHAYGDSASDLPMLRMVGRPLCVNPKRALRRAAPGMDAEIWT